MDIHDYFIDTREHVPFVARLKQTTLVFQVLILHVLQNQGEQHLSSCH